jgi:hypothetical protein
MTHVTTDCTDSTDEEANKLTDDSVPFQLDIREVKQQVKFPRVFLFRVISAIRGVLFQHAI